jgi:hypothetical protein
VLQALSRFEEISREDKLARAQSGLFEILRVGRETCQPVTFFPNS